MKALNEVSLLMCWAKQHSMSWYHFVCCLLSFFLSFFFFWWEFIYFLNLFYLLCYYSCPIFSFPLSPSIQHLPLPSAFPYLSSCPWVVHVSSLASPFPILFLTSPCLFSTYHLCCLFPFPTFYSHPLPADNPPCDLHFYDSIPVLVVCLVCFLFCLFVCFRFSC